MLFLSMRQPAKPQQLRMVRDHFCNQDSTIVAWWAKSVEKEMATHSSVLAWRIPGTGEPGGLSSLGSHRVGHDWSDLAAAAEPNQAYRWTLRAQHHKKNRFWISFCRACYLDSINPDYFTLHDLMLNHSTFLFGLIISCFVSCFTLWAIGCLDIWSNIVLGVSVRIFLDKSNI